MDAGGARPVVGARARVGRRPRGVGGGVAVAAAAAVGLRVAQLPLRQLPNVR